MSSPIFCKLSPAMTVGRMGAASDEGNLSFSEVAASTSNTGALQVRASGVPSAATSVLVRLVSGGIATGPTTQTEGIPGARFRWRLSTGSDSQYNGYTYAAFLRDIRVLSIADGTTTYPHVSGVRRLGNGSMGYVRVSDSTANSLEFGYKANRRAAYTYVTIGASGISVNHRPALAVLANGRLLAFAVMSATDKVRVWKSDDNGLTWSVWASRTTIVINSSGGALHAELVDDAVMVISGASELYTPTSTYVYWSADGGQNFALGGSVGSSLMLAGASLVTALGIPMYVTAVSDGSGAADVRAYPVAFGGAFGSYVAVYNDSVNDPNPVLGACAMDDGSLWVLCGLANYPAQAFDARVSVDGGLAWGAAGGGTSNAQTVADTQYNSGGYRGVSLGCFEGAIVVTARVDTSFAQDNSVHEWWLGGYDQLTETDTGGSSTGAREQVGYYGDNAGAVFFPTNAPDSLGWTKTDTGAGATIDITTGGINIVGVIGVSNTRYTSPSSFWSPDAGGSWRMNWVTNLTSGGSVAADVAYVMIAVSDGTNRQWVKVRLSSTQASLLDNSGALWTSAAGSFTGEIEWRLALAHDYPAAGGGQVALRYRKAADDAWTTAVEAQAVAEEAGVATEVIEFGGSSFAGGVNWSIAGIWIAPGSDELDAAWVNPSDLDGRPLPAFSDVAVVNNISIGGRGDAGSAGDLFTVTPAYAHGKKNLLRSLRPSCYAETLVDTADATYVFGDGTMPIGADVVAVFGSNYRTATLQLNTSDSWGSPAQTVSMDATLYASTVSASVSGLVALTGAAMIPHRYRSTPNRKYYLQLKANNQEIYEILDNDESRVYVTGLGTGYTGEAAWIFGDRMGARFVSSSRMYARLLIAAQDTASETFQTGTVWLGKAHTIEPLYDNGFVDSWEPNVSEWTTDAGIRQGARRGGETHKLRIAWGAIDRLTYDYVERVTRLFRGLDGTVEPVLFWRNPDDVSTLGLYTIDGPPGSENSYGELATAFERIPQIILSEYR